ncbi:MAG: FadR family transcriptional regulator [Gracilibacteraceae bacterium]|nr:FadR family transcriptional regulator [Gracilibacteraceae bacterium]
MEYSFQKLKAESLKDLFVKEMEAKIISGELKPGDRLPPEREIAAQMGISRSIVNSGLIELASKGFVAIKPRKGTIVIDFRSEGTAQILTSIMNYNQGRLDMKLFYSMIDTRMLIEVESAKLAARNRDDKDLEALENLLKDIEGNTQPSIDEIVEFNYKFHHRITVASGNIVFAMIFKSFEPVCKNLIRIYFEANDFRQESLEHHRQLYLSILERNSEESEKIMKKILLQGKKVLKNYMVPGTKHKNI